MASIKEIEAIKQTLIRIETSFNDVKLRMVDHINEGEKEGGFRDRVKDLEKQTSYHSTLLSSLKQAEWKRVIVAGMIGGIVARSPDVWTLILNFLR